MIEKAEVTALLQQLTAIKSAYFHEDEIMAFARDWLCRQELPAQLHEYHDAKVTDFHGKNVIAVIDGGRPGPVICLNGHLDTVQLCGGWTRDPYGELDGDRLYGVGALDMKSGCAALMVTAARFAAAHKTFAGKIKLALVSDEEGPYGLGTNALIEDGYLSDVDFSIITEPSAGFDGKPFPDVCLGARGGYGLEIRFYGKSAHAANPGKGHSALLDAAKVAQALEQVDYVEDPHLGKGTCCVVGINADGGACSVGVESTVISLAGAQPVLLRPGYITKEQLEDAMGCAVALSDAVLHKLKDGESAASPGMKYKHYAPKADVTILKGSFDAYKEYMKSHCADGVYALCFTGEEPALPCPCVTYGRADKPDEQAHALFSALRELDARGAKTVFARCPAQEGVAMAVYNRLLRAAAFRVVEV